MIAILNNTQIDLLESPFSLLNRGFKYGDGLFETIAVINGRARFITDHLHRLIKGADVLGLENTHITDEKSVTQNCQLLYKNARNPSNGVLRLYLVRDGDGLYTPVSRLANFLMTFESVEKPEIKFASKVGFSDRVKNLRSPISPFKTISALHYVLAGMEKAEKFFDEIIIKDYRGFISESLSANIFWRKGNSYFTPSIETGCIDGIMRKWLIEELNSKGFLVEEVLAPDTELFSSEAIFTVNALGVKHILSIEQHDFVIDSFVSELIESIS